MDPYLPLDYQIALLRGGYRTTTSLPIDIQATIILDNPYLTPAIIAPYSYLYQTPLLGYYPYYQRYHHHHHHWDHHHHRDHHHCHHRYWY